MGERGVLVVTTLLGGDCRLAPVTLHEAQRLVEASGAVRFERVPDMSRVGWQVKQAAERAGHKVAMGRGGRGWVTLVTNGQELLLRAGGKGVPAAACRLVNGLTGREVVVARTPAGLFKHAGLVLWLDRAEGEAAIAADEPPGADSGPVPLLMTYVAALLAAKAIAERQERGGPWPLVLTFSGETLAVRKLGRVYALELVTRTSLAPAGEGQLNGEQLKELCRLLAAGPLVEAEAQPEEFARFGPRVLHRDVQVLAAPEPVAVRVLSEALLLEASFTVAAPVVPILARARFVAPLMQYVAELVRRRYGGASVEIVEQPAGSWRLTVTGVTRVAEGELALAVADAMQVVSGLERKVLVAWRKAGSKPADSLAAVWEAMGWLAEASVEPAAFAAGESQRFGYQEAQLEATALWLPAGNGIIVLEAPDREVAQRLRDNLIAAGVDVLA